jgi:glucose-1-phosphate cytidylyltransferase
VNGIDEVVVLCGGRGTRLQAHLQEIPKPLAEIGGQPMVWHVIRIFAAQGLRSFVLCTGYRGDLIADFTERTAWPEGVSVRCLDTGLDTPTGGRIRAAAEVLAGKPFLATYADGMADVDLDALTRFHADHGGLATMTVVRPRLQFGVAALDGDGRVRSFTEKPRSEHWVNGGFFCLAPEAAGYISPGQALEGEPFERLAAAGQLYAFRHEGFWECMDTHKDAALLNELWAAGKAPWRLWE